MYGRKNIPMHIDFKGFQFLTTSETHGHSNYFVNLEGALLKSLFKGENTYFSLDKGEYQKVFLL